jgi:rhodanese-related sulfurtransferase
MKIRRLLSGMLAFFGLGCACGQQNYENLDVQKFAELIKSSDVTILDVRTVKEFSEGHINGALNIDVDGDGFLEEANMVLDKTKTIAVYCRSGRRSADAASKLADAGFKVVVMLPPYHRTRRVVNFRPASNFRIAYSVMTNTTGNRMYKTDPEENERDGWFSRELLQWGSHSMSPDFIINEKSKTE